MRTRHLMMLILACLFQIQFVSSQTNKLYIPPTDCPIGTTTNVEIRMDNRSEIVALQFNLHIPDVVTLDKSGMQLTEERKDDHTLSVTNKGGNNYLVIVMSMNNKAFKGNRGAILNLPLVIPKDLEIEKVYPFQFSNVVLSDRSGKNVMSSYDPGSIKIVDGNGPDITPKQIRLSSDNFKPGGKVSLQWNVENIGGRATEGGWNEQLYLVDEAGNEYSLGQASCNEIIPSKGSVSRQAEYNIDEHPGIEGKVKAKVVLTAFSGWELPVYRVNNENTSDAGLNMPKRLTWNMNATSIQEKNSPEIFCTLNRSGSRMNDEVFTIQNGNTSRLQLPASITIPQGVSGVSFNMKVIDDKIANSDSFVVVTVSGNKYEELKQKIWIEDDEHPYLKMSVNKESVSEGNTFTITVEREWTIKWPLTVRLSSNHPQRFENWPTEVIIPANANKKEVTITVKDDDLPGLDDEVVFTASAPGHTFNLTSGRFIKILDNDVPNIELTLSTATASEANQVIVAKLKRTGVTDNKITVNLTHDGDKRINIPSSIALEAGVSEKEFAITTVDNAMKDGDKTINIRGSIYISSCNCSTAGTKAGVFEKQITILDDDDAAVKSIASKTTLLEGETGKITISVNEVLNQPLAIKLSCDNKDLQFASSATIEAGKSSVDIPITVPKNSISEGNRITTIVIDAGRYGKNTCWLNITDQTLPDAVITTLKTDREITVQNSTKVSAVIKNEGAAVLPAQTKVSVYLSTSTSLNSSATALGNLYTQKELAIGESETLEKKLTFPDNAGAYYLIAIVNEDQSKKELSYVNNNATPFAIQLKPLYTVQVSLDKTVLKTGESVMITGRVSGSKTANVPVDLYTINNGYRDVIKVTTDNAGIFQTRYTPKNGFYGHFAVGACYPDEGLKTEMTGFDLYGLKKVSSGLITWEVFTNEKKSDHILLKNPGNKTLSNITAKIVSQPKNCIINFSSISSLAANSTAELRYEVMGTSVSTGTDWEPIKVQVISAEGAVLDLDIRYYCRSHAAQLEASESHINTTMTIGSTREYPLTITNTGKGETGEIRVALPDANWLSLANPAKIPSLKYGESATILLKLSPDANMEANIAHKGQFAINCANGNGIPISYRITPVSSEKGTLVVDVCDEYTYYTAEKPHVSGADVRVTMPNTNTVVAEGKTNANGLFTTELPSGSYTVEVKADKHDSYKNTVLVDPGKDNKVLVNLSFQAITYSWEVVETEVEDEYETKVVVKYETNVPVPVVVTEMPEYIPADELAIGESYVFDVKLTNKGLITANDVFLVFPQNLKSLEFELLVEDNFDLKAQQSVVIPVKMTRKGTLTKVTNDTNSDLPCYTQEVTAYRWKCNKESKWVKVPDGIRTQKVCPSKDIEEGNLYPTGMDEYELYDYILKRNQFFANAFSPIYTIMENVSGVIEKTICNPYVRATAGLFHPESPCMGTSLEMARDNVLETVQLPVIGKLLGIGGAINSCQKAINQPNNKYQLGYCLTGAASTVADIGGEALQVGGAVSVIAGVLCVATGVGAAPGAALISAGIGAYKIGDIAKKSSPIIGMLGNCGINFFENLDNIKNDRPSVTKVNVGTVSWIEDFENKFQIAKEEWNCISNIMWEILDDEKWYNCTVTDVAKLFSYIHSHEGILKKNEELYQYKPDAISKETFDQFIDRWNNSLKIWNGESISSTNYIDGDVLIENVNKIAKCEAVSISYGYTSTEELLYNIFYDLREQSEDASSSLCSSVSLQFSQTMVMTRQAFRGTLTVNNGHESEAMKDIKLDLTVSDKEGIVATSHEFQINPEKLDGFGGELIGPWTLEAQKSGTATILFIPTKYAAPTEPKDYTFGGTFSYIDPFTNTEVTRDLYPVTLTVKPSPNLAMDYFMQRDILGDDPLTKDVVEPMIPSEFSLLIHNIGAGDATNIRMTTKQPEIVDNEKGLLVNFKIKTSQLNGEEETPVMGESVQTDFGTIKAGETAYAQWWLTSTLLGHFTDYKVEATHVTSYDNPDLSLLDEVRIHELIRGIRVDESKTPKVTGFMVNDIPDAEDCPDMMYLTDGTVAPVVKATDAKLTTTGNSTYQLIVTPSANGWNYIHIPDPTGGRLKLISVNENTNLDTRKVWQTDRTLRDGKDPKYEYLIHVVDYFENSSLRAATSSGSFKLVFEEQPETILAVESITGLPEGEGNAAAPISKITVKFNKPVSAETLTGDIILLYCQGGKINTDAVSWSKQDGQTYILDLSTATKQNGYYNLTILTSEIKDSEGFTGEEDKTVSWTQQTGGKVKLTGKAEPEKAGSVSPASIETDYINDVKFTAIPATGYTFKNWMIEGKEVSTDNPYQHVAIADQTIVANFNPISYSIEINYDATNGSVSFGTGYYEYDSSLELIATPHEGYRFVGWFIDGKLVSSNELFVYKVTGDAKLEARFKASSSNPDDPNNPDNPDDPTTPDDPNNPSDPDDPTANESLESLVIQVYPTLVKDYVHIDNLPAKSRLLLFNIYGQIVKEVPSCKDNFDLYVGNQPSGIYLLHIVTEDSRKQTVKLIKK